MNSELGRIWDEVLMANFKVSIFTCEAWQENKNLYEDAKLLSQDFICKPV